MKKITTGSIDVTKIEKDKLYKGKKGTYLNISIIWKDQPDEYGNHGMVVQDVGKEAREAGEQGAILGNVKNLQVKQKSQPEPEHRPDNPDDGDSLPF